MTATEQATVYRLESPYPAEHLLTLYRWFREFPNEIMDDFWLREYREYSVFSKELNRRGSEEKTWMIAKRQHPVGFVGFLQLSPHLGQFRGVCFDQSVHGDGTALRSVRQILQQIFDSGVHKVMAFPFSDNRRAIQFYRKLGASEANLQREHTLRGGKLTDVLQMAFFAPKDGYCA